jgi:hypothetical protein
MKRGRGLGNRKLRPVLTGLENFLLYYIPQQVTNSPILVSVLVLIQFEQRPTTVLLQAFFLIWAFGRGSIASMRARSARTWTQRCEILANSSSASPIVRFIVPGASPMSGRILTLKCTVSRESAP